MKQVTVSFKNSRKQDETATFNIYSKAERDEFNNISLAEKMAAIDSGRVGRDDWADEDSAEIEKAAALQAGIAQGETFYYIRIK